MYSLTDVCIAKNNNMQICEKQYVDLLREKFEYEQSIWGVHLVPSNGA